MDSVTQIILGAAVGEAILGKKLGNKAIVAGGIAGTIPDLDVLFGPFMSEVDGLAFHRGISHSIFFAIIGGLFFGWCGFRLYNKKRTQLSGYDSSQGSLKEWQLLFILGMITHALLDSFTMYGTQLFAPFSDYRVAINSIAVADFFYTVPFAICLLISIFSKRGSRKRRFWNYLGLGVSSIYLIFTLINKSVMTSHFKSALADQNIAYTEYIVGPTLLTNFLWNITVDAGDQYYSAKYSWFDKSPIQFESLEKNHHLIGDAEDDKTINILKWFTKEFYSIIINSKGQLQFNDLRYGTFGNSNLDNNFVFRFILEKNPDGSYTMTSQEGGPAKGEEKKVMTQLWNRIMGV